MTIPYLTMLERVIPEYVTSETVPVSPETVLMRIPLSESLMVLFEIVTVVTSLSVRPPTDPMERPWPPEQVPPVNLMLVPELMARQSSWFLMFAPEIVMSVDEPTSKASVLWPSELLITSSVYRIQTRLKQGRTHHHWEHHRQCCQLWYQWR